MEARAASANYHADIGMCLILGRPGETHSGMRMGAVDAPAILLTSRLQKRLHRGHLGWGG